MSYTGLGNLGFGAVGGHWDMLGALWARDGSDWVYRPVMYVQDDGWKYGPVSYYAPGAGGGTGKWDFSRAIWWKS